MPKQDSKPSLDKHLERPHRKLPDTSLDNRTSIPNSAILLIALLALTWGLLWPVMKFAVSQIPYMTFRMVSAWGSSMVIFVVLVLLRKPLLIRRAEILPLLLAALFNVTGWLGFSGWGLTLLSAGRATVIAYTMPVWAFIAAIILFNERGSYRHLFGVLFGLGAVVLLLRTELDDLSKFPLGIVAMLCAAITWGIGSVIQSQISWVSPMTTITAWQLLLGGIPLSALAFTLEPNGLALATASGWWAVVVVILIGTALGLNLWFKILQLVPTNVASLGILPVPIIGVFSASIILGEPTGWTELMALILVTAALGTILPILRSQKSNPRGKGD